DSRRGAAQESSGGGHPGGIDADDYKTKFARFTAELLDLRAPRIGFQQRMVDERSDISRNFTAGIQAKPRRAGVDHAAHAIGAAVVEYGVAFAHARASAPTCRVHLFGDDALKIRPKHVCQVRLKPDTTYGLAHPPLSRSRIFVSRRIYRGSVIGVLSQTVTISSASAMPTNVAPRLSTFAPLCWRA